MNIRRAAVAGSWYPGSADALAAAVERHLAQTYRDLSGDLEPPIPQQTIRVRGDRTRVHEAGVRRDEGHEVARQVALGLREMTLDGRRERIRRARIPAARDRRPSDVHEPSTLSP